MPNSKKFVAEFLGTFGLILYGAGAVLQQQMTQAVGVTGIAVAHGLAILVGIYALGHISGGHFNPAVTMGFLVTRRFSFRTTLLYWVAQLLGGVVAAWILALVYTQRHRRCTSWAPRSPILDPPLSLAALLEGIAAFLLVLIVFGSAVDPRAPKGFAGARDRAHRDGEHPHGRGSNRYGLQPRARSGRRWWRASGRTSGYTGWGPPSGGGVAGILYDRLSSRARLEP